MVLEAAINGRADCLVTFNQRDFAAASSFHLWIPRPSDFLSHLKGGEK